ncbi:MAG TPA: hypothetical protein VLX58_19475 [Bryobacteraceae bacterium]|nr:hypothetical protein [Bryobacteraceae bacterium]
MVGSHRSFLVPVILVSIAAAAPGQSFDALAHGLAQKITASIKPQEPVWLSFRNISSLSAFEGSAAETALDRELRGLNTTADAHAPGATMVTVTFSEDSRGLVWIAEIRRGDAREVVMEASPKASAVASATSVVVEKRLVLEQEQRILDLAPLAHGLLVLDGESVSVWESAGAGWQRKLSTRIPVSRPWPRDLRGRIAVQSDVYQAYLPGLVCNGNTSGGLSITCREATLWPVGTGPQMLGLAEYAPSRNFFEGRLVAPNGSEKRVPAFFSAAKFQVRDSAAWALAGVDGRVYLLNSPMKNSGAWAGWGSSMAGVESECGARSQVFATAAGDSVTPDSVRVFDIVDGTPRPAGEVAFPGPVTALWPASEHGVAFAVSRDLKSGRYGAFRLAITCAH